MGRKTWAFVSHFSAKLGDVMHHLLKGTEFLQRIGVIPAELQPQPALAPGDWKVHREPLVAPLPAPEAVVYLDGEPPPDRVVTGEWPPVQV